MADIFDVTKRVSPNFVQRLVNLIRELDGEAPVDFPVYLDLDETVAVLITQDDDGKITIGRDVDVDDTYVTCALTGTALTTPTEAEYVTGGQTIIITLTNDEWVPAVAFNNTVKQAIVDGFSGEAVANGWDVQIGPNISLANVVRTSDTVVTITLPAAASYSIAGDETITFVCPKAALVRAGFPLAAETWDIVNA